MKKFKYSREFYFNFIVPSAFFLIFLFCSSMNVISIVTDTIHKMGQCNIIVFNGKAHNRISDLFEGCYFSSCDMSLIKY